jgi:mRNA interferase RelE/StbE
MNVRITKSFEKEVKPLPNFVKERVLEVIETLQSSTNLESTHLDYIKCKGVENHRYYRIRIGSYRIGIKYVYPDVVVLVIFNRQENYKRFPPKD